MKEWRSISTSFPSKISRNFLYCCRCRLHFPLGIVLCCFLLFRITFKINFLWLEIFLNITSCVFWPCLQLKPPKKFILLKFNFKISTCCLYVYVFMSVCVCNQLCFFCHEKFERNLIKWTQKLELKDKFLLIVSKARSQNQKSKIYTFKSVFFLQETYLQK